LWINDFNQNGSLDKILTYTIDGRDVPVFLKSDMQDEIPSIKKQNLKHQDYAKKSIQELFPEDVIKKSTVKTFNYPSSIVALNEGNGNFKIEKLPVMTQLSSVNSIRAFDVNGDGKNDLVTGGNLFTFLPQFERLDGSFGDVLLNNGKGNFKWLPQKKTGLDVEGMVRDIVTIPQKDGTYVLFLRNNDYPVSYIRKNEKKPLVKNRVSR